MADTVEIDVVTLEHHRENIGIGEPRPRISWKLKNAPAFWIQSAYEIEILSSVSPDPQVFHVESSDSILVPWPAKALISRHSLAVRVKVYGTEPCDWSHPVIVEAGLLSRSDWTSQLIAAKRILAPNGTLTPILFRKEFAILNNHSTIKKARLYITAHGIYEAHVNGVRVGDHVLAPGWTSYKHHLNYQTFAVAALLKEGENRIEVHVGEGWFSTRLGFNGGKRDIYGDRLAVLAQLEILLENGETQTINSDGSWQFSNIGSVISSEIYDGEVCDLSIPTGSLGFEGVEEMDFPSSKLQASKGPPVRKIESIRPKKVLRSPSGKVIVDFGQNLVGWVRVVVAGPRGRRIVFTHTEVLENGEIATRPLRDCKAIDTLILDGREAPIEWEPKFTFHGFRYVQIEGWPSDSGEPALSDISAVVIHTDMEPTGSFKCSDDKINQLHSNIRWGMRGNFVSIPTDCPQRDERLGWTGDIQIFAPTANFLFDTSDMLAGWLQDLAAEQLRDYHNVPPLVCPNVIDTAFSKTQAAWADAVIIVPYALHQSFGDKRILEQQYESMKAWIDHGLPRGENRLWDPEVHQLGDWLDPAAPPAEPGNGRTDPHFVANAYLVHITTLMAEISRILESSEDHERYVADAKELKKEFQYQYITPSGRLSPDSMTALCLALSFSLFPTHEQEICAAARLALLVRKSNFRIATGFVGTPLICPILCKYGYEQIAYRMLLNTRCPSWLYPIVKHGATTMWERWDSMLEDGSVNPGSMTSFNHYALGSVGAWLHSTVGGISPLEPGWKKIRFAPVPGGTITSAEVGYESCYGRVECEWKIEDGELKPEDEKEGERGGDKERKKSFWMKATLPPYTTGEIKLPTREKSFEVGSGVHEWQEEYEVPDWPPKAIRDPFATDGDTDD